MTTSLSQLSKKLYKILLKKLLKWQRNQKVDHEDRLLILNNLIDQTGFFPISDILKQAPDGRLIIKGKTLGVDEIVQLQTSADALKDNLARKIISDQMRFEAVKLGVHQSTNTEMLVFAKAALWILEEQEKLIDNLSS